MRTMKLKIKVVATKLHEGKEQRALAFIQAVITVG